jgi:membrane-anchored glycerophosphoryl diester phosphodiesterase (GDPDase)
MIFKKPIAQLFIAKCGLQILKVSGNLEILDVNVVEIPWKYPVVFYVLIVIVFVILVNYHSGKLVHVKFDNYTD